MVAYESTESSNPYHALISVKTYNPANGQTLIQSRRLNQQMNYLHVWAPFVSPNGNFLVFRTFDEQIAPNDATYYGSDVIIKRIQP